MSILKRSVEDVLGSLVSGYRQVLVEFAKGWTCEVKAGKRKDVL